MTGEAKSQCGSPGAQGYSCIPMRLDGVPKKARVQHGTRTSIPLVQRKRMSPLGVTQEAWFWRGTSSALLRDVEAGHRYRGEAFKRLGGFSSGTRASSWSPRPSLALDSDDFWRCGSFGQPTRFARAVPLKLALHPLLEATPRVLSYYALLCTPQTCFSFIFANNIAFPMYENILRNTEFSTHGVHTLSQSCRVLPTQMAYPD